MSIFHDDCDCDLDLEDLGLGFQIERQGFIRRTVAKWRLRLARLFRLKKS